MNSSTMSNHSHHGHPDVSRAATDHIFSEEMMATAKKMHQFTNTYVGPFIALFGLTGNILSFIIWRKKSMRSSTGTYLVAQAVNDIGAVLFFFLTECLVALVPVVKKSYAFGVFYSYVGFPLFAFFIVNGIWTLVAVTLDRYIQVCWINHSKKMCNENRAKTGIALITVLTFTINIPHFMFYYVVPGDAYADNESSFVATDFGGGNGGMLYEFWVHCMFLVLIPWITILFMNLSIICRLNGHNKLTQQSKSQHAQKSAKRKEMQITRTLLTVTFTYLGLVILQCITQCFFMLEPGMADMKMVNEAYSVAKFGLVTNAAINFALYCITGERFRKELRLTLYKVVPIKALIPVPDAQDLYLSSSNDQTDSYRTDGNERNGRKRSMSAGSSMEDMETARKPNNNASDADSQ